MADVIPLRAPRLVPPPTPYAAFVADRQAMMRSLAAWLRTDPGAAAAAAEMDGTLAMMDQLRQLEAAHG